MKRDKTIDSTAVLIYQAEQGEYIVLRRRTKTPNKVFKHKITALGFARKLAKDNNINFENMLNGYIFTPKGGRKKLYPDKR